MGWLWLYKMNQPRVRAALVKLVLDGEAGEKANKYSTNDLVSAIKISNFVLVENLLNLGHNPNVHVGNNSTTPLLCAISVGSIEIVRLSCSQRCEHRRTRRQRKYSIIVGLLYWTVRHR